MSTAGSRLTSLDILKGIAIILVVVGHWYPDDAPDWWRVINKAIYSFHMPVFMASSGFLYALTYRPVGFGAFVLKKFKRLMVPYFSVSVVILLIKISTERIMTVENPVTAVDFIEMLYYPSAGYYLWFLWALWWIFVVVYWFNSPHQRLSLFFISLIIAYLPYQAPDILCLRQAQQMLVYFVAGELLHDYRRVYDYITRGHTLFITSLFVVLLSLYLAILPATEFLLPYAGIAAMLAISSAISRSQRPMSVFMAKIGIYSFGIYLFHTTFEGFAKAMLLKLYPMLTAAEPWWLFATGSLIIIATGVIFPIVLYRYAIDRYRVARFLFGSGL